MESNTQKRKRVKKEGAEKVYEDDRWLIVRPFTIEASSMYGRNTQWCTVRNPNTIVDKIHVSLFYGYLALGGVYYILDKSTSSRDNKYRKVGVQKNWDATEVWNDATNTPLTSKEIVSFKNKLNPHIVKYIYNNWNILKPIKNKPFVFNPITITKSYYNKNLTNHLATAVAKYEHNLKVKGWIVLIYFLLALPLLPFVYLFRNK